MATMDGQDVKSSLEGIYKDFMADMKIDEDTGIAYCGIPCAKEGEEWKFATMPYIGKCYDSAEQKILFIGLDLGKDIKKGKDKYLKFESRHDTILRTKNEQELDYNPHIAGTYALALAILSQCDKYSKEWGPAWNRLVEDKFADKKTTATLVHKYHKELPKDENNVLEYVGLTNLFKFVTVGRKKAAGGRNRHWINEERELKLLIDEIDAFNPDIIILQGSGNYMPKEIIDYCKKDKGIIVIKGKHPSAWKCGWNKISGVKWHLDKYIKKMAKKQGTN